MSILSSVTAFVAGMRHRMVSRLLRTWYSPHGCSSAFDPLRPLLSLAAAFYARGLQRNQAWAQARSKKLPRFVISVGNLAVGGTGKTPLTLSLARNLYSRGFTTAILSRGYGRKQDDVVRVPTSGQTASLMKRFGDEPVLMARKIKAVPVWVGRERTRSGEAAIGQSGAMVLLLDDGFQHIELNRDLNLLLLDAHHPFGNGRLIPLGPLREPPEAIHRADAIILTRADDAKRCAKTREFLREHYPGKPIFSCRHQLMGLKEGLAGPILPPEVFHNQPAVAFAGIARPELFFRSLDALRLRLCRCLDFPDHSPYGAHEIELIMTAVRETHARFLITTEKDFVRLPEYFQKIILTAELEVDFGAESEAFYNYVKQCVLRIRPEAFKQKNIPLEV